MTYQITKQLTTVFAALLILVLSINSAEAQYSRSDDRDGNRVEYQSKIFNLYQSNSFESIPWITLFNDPLLEPQKVIDLYEEKSIGKDLQDLHRRINKRFYYYKSIRGLGVTKENPFLWEDDIADAIKKSKKSNSSSDSRANANFQFIGQTVSPLSTNVGRIERINFHPTDPNTVWASAPEGGLWRSNDAGTNWTLMSDFWDHMSVGDLVYNMNNHDTIYCATGDHDSWFNLNRGILRSDDGGSTWNIVGLPYSQAQDVHKLMMHPDGSTVIACSSQGIFTSTDHGVTWTAGTLAKDVNDLEFHPTNSDIMYASERGGGSPYTGYFHVSTDGGQTWTQQTATMDSEGQTTQVTVSPNNANIAYIGIYPSGAATFAGIRVMKYDHTAGTIVSVSNPSTTYSHAIPGAWDFRIEVDPNDANHVIYGCVHNYQSFDGGLTWAHLPTLHADVHDIKWQATSGKMWIADDGGLGVSTDAGASWTGFSNLPVMQWAAVASSDNGNVMVLGAQDAGNQIDMGGFYSQPRGGGDGLLCAVDPVDTNITYTTVQVGLELNRLDYDPTTQSYDVNHIMNQSIGGNVATWAQQIIIDRDDHNTIYTNYADIWKSTDRGENWTNITNGSFGNNGAAIGYFQQSQSHPDIMYGGLNGTTDLRKSTDRGLTWTAITHPGTYLFDNSTFKIHPEDPDKLYTIGNSQVNISVDGGMTWTNITGTLPPGPFNIAIHPSANEGIYVAGNLGILYYRDNTLSDWVIHEENLPNVRIYHLEVLEEINKIRVATWGRGIWEGDTYANSVNPCSEPAPPIVDFQRCASGTTATIGAAPTDYTIAWYKDGALISGQTSTILSITMAGTYTARYLDDNGTCHSYLSDPINYAPVGVISLIGGNGLHFDGVDDQVVFPATDALELGNRNFSITFWAKRDGINSADYLIEQGNNNTNKKLHIGFDGSNSFKFGFFGDDLLTSDQYIDNDWHHWACVYDHEIASPAHNRFIYRDGVLAASDRSNAPFSGGGELKLSWNSNAFKGTVDELMIYGSVLSPAEIDDNIHCPIDCIDPDILLYLPFQEGTPNGDNTGYTLVDYSLYNHTSTLNNFDLNNTASNIVDGLELDLAGSDVVCPDMSWSYSVPPVDGATYAWTNPSGWTGTSTTNTIILDPTSTGGTIQCIITAPCGNYTLTKTVSSNEYCETAFDFDGVDDQINFAEASVGNFGTGDFTIEYWIKTTDATAAIIAKRTNCGCDSWSVLIDNGLPRMEVVTSSCSGSNLFGTKQVNDGEWHHIAFSRSGTDWHIFIDGILNNSSTLSDDIDNTNSLHLGYISCGAVWNLDGTIDEVKIWNEARTATQLNDNRFCTINTIPTNLAFYLPFEDGIPEGDNTGSTSTTDRVTNATGNVVNAALTGSSSNFETGVDITRFPDADMDGYGLTSGVSTRFCLTGTYIFIGGDCDDTDNMTNPNSDEICGNGIDENCNGVTDENSMALHFDGSNDYVDLGTSLGSFGTGDFTIEVSFKSAGVLDALISKRGICGCDNFWNATIAGDGRINFEIFELNSGGGCANGANITSTTIVNNDQWHHLAITRTNNWVNMYINGVVEATGYAPADINNNYVLELGKSICEWTNYDYNGSMDEVRIWNISRSSESINLFKDASLVGNEAGLQAYYNFNNENVGHSMDNAGQTTLEDITTNAFDGTLIDFALTGTTSNWVGNPEVTMTWYADTDMDGYGDPNVSTISCSQPTGYVMDNNDCDDTNINVNPGQSEVCGNLLDDNCNQTINENCDDMDVDGFTTAQGDCDDTNPDIYPGAPEMCNGIDDDCNMMIDDGLNQINYYQDADGDGFGNPQVVVSDCSQPTGYVLDNTDCQDNNASIYPGAPEILNGIDDNCNGTVDEGATGTPVTGITAACFSTLEDSIMSMVNTHNIPGLTIAFGVDEKIQYMRAFGHADLGGTEIAQTYHKGRIASLSKAVTQAAILKLIDDGLLNFNDKVFGPGGILGSNPYYSGYTDTRINDITVKHLFDHRGGWDSSDTDCFPNPTLPYTFFSGCDPIGAPLAVTKALGESNPVSKEALIKFLLLQGLDHDPGTTYAYSNIGYLTLGRVISQVSGKDYEQYLQDEIMDPLGMCDSEMAGNYLADKKEREWEYHNGPWMGLDINGSGSSTPLAYGYNNINAGEAHGGWISTSRDILRLFSGTNGLSGKPDFISSSTLPFMATNHAGGWLGHNSQWITGPGGFSIILIINERLDPNNPAFASAFFTELPNYIQNNMPSCVTYDLMLVPDTNSDNFSFTNQQLTSSDVSWVSGDGDKRIIVAKANGPVDAEVIDGLNYTASAAFGSGTELGNGNFVMYDGSGSTFNATNLTPGVEYHFRAYEYNQNTNTGNYSLYKQCDCGVGKMSTGITVTVANQLCAGDNVNIAYASSGLTFSGGNIFTAQLSNNSGSFANPIILGTISSTSANGSINGLVPANTAEGSTYRIRVISSSPSSIGADNGEDITINELKTWYQDTDGDNFGNTTMSQMSCSQPAGYVLSGNDCDDNNININPLSDEICSNMTDDNCDGQVDAMTNRALSFDGVDDWISNDLIQVPNIFTLEAWVKVNSSGNQTIASWSDNFNHHSQLIVESGFIRYKATSSFGGNWQTGNYNIGNDTWRHIVLVKNNDSYKIYVDGVLRVTTTFTISLITDDFRLGSLNWKGNHQNFFAGSMDDVRIWSDERTLTEINDNMLFRLDGTEANLERYFTMDQGFSSGVNSGLISVRDHSMSNSNATLNNFGLTGATSNWIDGQAYQFVYADLDMDGYGGTAENTCGSMFGLISDNSDCDDDNSAINPTALDICGNGIDENCNGIVDENSMALDFDGVDDHVNFGNTLGNFGTSDFTIEMNIKTNVAERYILAKRDICSVGNFWNIRIEDNGVLKFAAFDTPGGTGTYSYVGTTIVTDNNWHHIAMIRKNGFFSMYLDGVLEVSGNMPANLNNTALLEIGDHICDFGEFDFSGSIDELRIWSVARTAEEISSFKDATMSVSTDMAAYYDFNNPNVQHNASNAGQITLEDRTPNNNDGTLSNFALSGTTSNWIGNPEVTMTWYADTDTDGFGDPNVSQISCSQPTGYVLDNNDCDDTNININPNQIENTSNGIDDDCDGAIDESSSTRWVLLDDDVNGSCTSSTDCCSNTYCFGLEYTPGTTGQLAAYTTGFLVDCLGAASPLTSNASCVMSDNSSVDVNCMNGNGIKINASGNNGSLPITVGVPVIIHQVCLTIQSGESVSLDEDIVTDISMSIDLNSGGAIDDFPTFTSTSANGNAAPVLTMGSIGSCYTTIAAAEAAAIAATTSTDDCSSSVGLTVSTSGTCSATITVTGTDDCGLTSSVMYSTKIDGNSPETIGSLNDENVEGCDASAAPSAKTTVAELEAMAGDLAISDACTDDISLVVTSTDASTGTCPLVVTRTYTIKDDCDNEVTITHTINIDDSTAPTVSGSLTAADIEGCDASAAPDAKTTVAELEAMTGDLTISDVCTDNASLTVTSADASSGTCPLVVTRTYTIKDACDNETTLTHTINIDDNTAPVVSGSLTAADIEGCDAIAAPDAKTTVAELEAMTGDLAISDACSDDASLSVTSADASAGTCPLVVTRTYTIKDACDNETTLTHTININDETAPTISGSLTAADIEGCDASVVPDPKTTVAELETMAGDLLISDICTDDANISVTSADASSGTCPLVVTRTYTIKDDCDNEATFMHIININDDTAPTISGSLTATDIEGCDASAAPDAKTTITELEAMTGDLLITDACTDDAILTVTSADASAGTCPLVVTRTYTIKDACDNEATFTHIININDDTAPTISGSLTATDIEGCDASAAPDAKTTVAELEAMTGDLLISDACTDDTNLTVTNSDASAGTCPLVVTRTYTIKDACDNETTLTHIINIIDSTDPILTMGSIESCYETEAEAITAALAATTGSDNCSGSLTYTSAVTGSCPSMIMITGTDACNNSASVAYSSVITNGALPTESGGPAEIDSSIQISLDAIAPSLPVIVDACNNILQPSIPVIGGTYQEGDCSGTITYMYTYEDCAGSTFDWTFTYNLDCKSINIKGYVEGSYDSAGDSLTLDYNKYHLLPGQDKSLSNNLSIIIGAEHTPFGQPYDAMPWNYTGNMGAIYGDQSSPNAPANVISYPSHVFDWVLITIRKDGITAADNVFQCAGWLHKDGEISFPETCPDDLNIDANAAYYIVLEHRNHMAALDTATVMDNGSYLDIDFSINDSYAPIFRKGQKEIESGIFGLYGGNTDQILSRLSINSVDRTNWKIDQNKIGYHKGDIDQNVSTNSQDETKWKQNQNTTTGVQFDD